MFIHPFVHFHTLRLFLTLFLIEILIGCGETSNSFSFKANAGLDQSVTKNDNVLLSGTGKHSNDSNLTYRWSFSSKPDNSSAILDNLKTPNPHFITDKIGTYIVQLTLTDSKGNAAHDSVQIIVSDNKPSLPKKEKTPEIPVVIPEKTPIIPPKIDKSDYLKDKTAVSRFLHRATFGATSSEINQLAGTDISNWFKKQFSIPHKSYLKLMQAEQLIHGKIGHIDGNRPNQMFGDRAIAGNDQLRLRMVLALSEIVVASAHPVLGSFPIVMGRYVDILSKNALGNFRTLLHDITYSVAMGKYLTYIHNQKSDPKTGRLPDENYAREIMQLFTIGLVQLNIDGSIKLDEKGVPLETYTNDDIKGLAKVFTGLSADTPTNNFFNPFDDGKKGCNISATCPNFHKPMIIYPKYHSSLEKKFLGTVIPPNTTGEESIRLALDTLFNHPNVAPFLAKRLIQRFITSNPTPNYIKRVAIAFESGTYLLPNGESVGKGVRGDLKATITAVLLDSETIDPRNSNNPTFGKIREPYIRFINWTRAFSVKNPNMQYIPLQGHDNFRQTPFRAPSVFNFFKHTYKPSPSSAIGQKNLLSPELSLMDVGSIYSYINLLNHHIYEFAPRPYKDKNGLSQLGIKPDYTYEYSLINTPRKLVEHLDLLLTSNQLTKKTKTSIVDVINEITILPKDAEYHERSKITRVYVAISMVMTSPEYLVQK
jgi:uncharacterized protein (DUF1800 family)